MNNVNFSRSFAIAAFGAVLASGAFGASYLATSTGSFTLTYGPLMLVTLGATPTATASRTGTGSAASSSTGVFSSPIPFGVVLPQTIGGNWTTSASGSSGADGTATSEATFDYTLTLTNLAPGPNLYKLLFSYTDFAGFAAAPPDQSATVYSFLDATQTSFVAGNNSYSDTIYKSTPIDGWSGSFTSPGSSSFTALMLPGQTDTLTIDLDQGGTAAAQPAAAPEPPPVLLGALGIVGVARRRRSSTNAVKAA